MEDAVTMCALPCGGTFLAVYDGHGGASAALHAASTLHNSFASALDARMGDAAAAFTEAYADVDEQLRIRRALAVGATAVTAYIDAASRTLVVANAGDSRAVIADSAGNAERLSVDHRACAPSERARVRAAGGFVCSGRVNGCLAVSRALGDHCMKSVVVCTPATNSVPLERRHRFLILACDGLWDVIDDNEAVTFVSALLDDRTAPVTPSPRALAAALVRRALEAGSTDNISVIVVIFDR